MDVFSIVRVLIRRWYVVLPLLFLAGIAAFGAASRMEPEYGASGSVVVIDRISAGNPVGPAVLAEIVQDGAIRNELRSRGADAGYQIAVGDEGILKVVANSPDPQQAVNTVGAVLDMLAEQMESRQAAGDVSAELRAKIEPLSRPVAAEVVPGTTQWRAFGSVRVVGAGVGDGGPFSSRSTTLLLASVLESHTVSSRLAAEGATASYEVTTTKDSPLVEVTATGTDPEVVTGTVSAVMEASKREVAGLYELAGVGGTSNFGVERLSEPVATVQSRGVFRSVVVLLVLGVAVAVGAALLVESMSEWRRAHRRGKEPDAPVAGAEDQPVEAPEPAPPVPADADRPENEDVAEPEVVTGDLATVGRSPDRERASDARSY
jgi:capsular polysaccharide biosynthesis protein